MIKFPTFIFIAYLCNMSCKIASFSEFGFYTFISGCAEGVGVEWWTFCTCGDNSFVAELIRDNNNYIKYFGGDFLSELGDADLSVHRCVGISAVQLWVSVSSIMGGRVGSKCHRGQKEQEDLEKENAGMTVYLTF